MWFGDIPVATLRPDGGSGIEIFYVHTDHLNTPRVVTQASDDEVRWRWQDAAFGDALPDEDPSDVGTFEYNLRFPGQYFDEETELHYNYFRDYDPVTGRYVQSDPIGLGGGANTYAYVDSSPETKLDPYGLCDCGLIDAPEYDVSGTVSQGTTFRWDAKFKDSGMYDADCCEVRQLISWNKPWSSTSPAPHSGFAPPRDQPGQWYEDRDARGKRYGRRSGPYTDLTAGDWYHLDEYDGQDTPNGPANPGFNMRFRLIVVDICNGNKTIYTSKTITVAF